MSARSGFVSILGKPNVGKSTLLNQILGEKIAAISPKPQTTRNRIRGIKTMPDAQIVFVDTPGVHTGKKALNRYMNQAAFQSIPDSDIALVLIDVAEQNAFGANVNDHDRELLKRLADGNVPIILVLNKVDRVSKDKLLPIIDLFKGFEGISEIVPISAETGDGVVGLVRMIATRLPEGPFYYPEDQVTEESLRFLVAELIREQVFRCLKRELPYSTAVMIEQFTEIPEKGLTEIHAVVVVERESQKKIVIGSKGESIKRIGTRARAEIEPMLEQKVFLSLFVRVEPKWTRTERGLKKLGYE